MNDDASTAAALQEIAALLRRRVEQEDEVAERTVCRQKDADAQSEDASKMMHQSRQTSLDLRKQSDEAREQHRREKELSDAETREFREKLLAEFARHNDLLERIAAPLEK